MFFALVFQEDFSVYGITLLILLEKGNVPGASGYSEVQGE